MSTQISVEASGDRALVVKRGGAAEAGRLRAEGERLRRASHPGVVELVRSGPDGEGWELRMVHGGRPLEAADDLTTAQAAALVAGVASTVADLHDLGLVHGRIDPSHVLRGEHGRAILCGFGDGSNPSSPADDVAALGALLGDLVGSEAEGEPIPERRWRRRRAWAGWDRRALLLLADQATAEPPTRRPSARRLAAAVAATVPTPVASARLHGAADAESPRAPTATGAAPAAQDVDPMASLRAGALVGAGDRTVRRPVLVAGVVGAVLVAIGVGQLDGPPPEEPSPRASAAGPVPEEVAAPLPGGELTVAGVRYRVGRPGDVVLVDDWDCDGTPTPALLRPSTGEVFVFPRLITRGEQQVSAALTVAGATDLVARDQPDGCPSLAVRTHEGAHVPVTERPT